jgi:uncharacterized protein YbcI
MSSVEQDGAGPRAEQREPPTDRGQMLLDISNAVVGIHKQFYGKGPTKARSHLSHDLLTVVLEGGFTRAEQKLHEGGHDAEVAQSRAAMQQVAAPEMLAAVESVLGRRVRSFMSASDPVHGFASEIFVLHPDEDAADDRDLSSRAQRARDRHRDILDEHRALRAEQVQSRHALQEERDSRH